MGSCFADPEEGPLVDEKGSNRWISWAVSQIELSPFRGSGSLSARLPRSRPHFHSSSPMDTRRSNSCDKRSNKNTWSQLAGAQCQRSSGGVIVFSHPTPTSPGFHGISGGAASSTFSPDQTDPSSGSSTDWRATMAARRSARGTGYDHLIRNPTLHPCDRRLRAVSGGFGPVRGMCVRGRWEARVHRRSNRGAFVPVGVENSINTSLMPSTAHSSNSSSSSGDSPVSTTTVWSSNEHHSCSI